MSPVAIIIVGLGVVLAMTRGPLIVAPLKVRDYYLHLLETVTRMRLIGLAIAALGIVCIMAGRAEPGTPADLVFAFGVFILALMTFFFIPFAASARRLATSIWGGFSETTLRVLGLLSTTAGIALIYYGLSL